MFLLPKQRLQVPTKSATNKYFLKHLIKNVKSYMKLNCLMKFTHINISIGSTLLISEFVSQQKFFVFLYQVCHTFSKALHSL